MHTLNITANYFGPRILIPALYIHNNIHMFALSQSKINCVKKHGLIIRKGPYFILAKRSLNRGHKKK